MSLQSFMTNKFAEIKSEKERSDLETNIKFGLLNNRFDSLSHDVANLLGCFRNINDKLTENLSHNAKGSFSHYSSSGGRSSSPLSSSQPESSEGNSDEEGSDRFRRSKRKRGEDTGGLYYFDPLPNESENFTKRTVNELSKLCQQNCDSFLQKLNDTTSKEHEDYNFILHIRFDVSQKYFMCSCVYH